MRSLVLLAAMAAAQSDMPLQDSGICAQVGETPDQRVSPPVLISPGDPPVLAFRFFEGKQHHRFGNDELLLDDAGH